MGSNRAEKLAGVLKKKISGIIQTELKDPRIGFVTITRVEVSKDLKYVKVFFSVLGTEKEKKSAVIGLGRATSFVRRLIAQEVDVRVVPEIVFKIDETYEYALRVNELLERIKKEEKEKHEGNKEGS